MKSINAVPIALIVCFDQEHRPWSPINGHDSHTVTDEHSDNR
jgi:hypothetical protein